MIKGSFPISKVLVFGVIATYVEKMKILITILWFAMVKSVIKGSFPISKVLVFEGNSYVCWKNEDIRLFYDCNGKECD